MRKHITIVVLTVATLAFGLVARGQEGYTPPTPVAPDDYVQILQLYARYSHAVDLVWDDGSAYAANFAEDGMLRFANNEIRGRKAIKEWARKNDRPRPERPKGWRAGHTMSNFEVNLIEPGLANVIAYFHEGERVSDDLVVKTPQGWLIKRRSPACGNEKERAIDPQRPPCPHPTN